jgi:hypothetical protein
MPLGAEGTSKNGNLKDAEFLPSKIPWNLALQER